MSRIEGTVRISELFEYMREQGLVIVPKELATEERLKDKILKKKWITQKEIADSKIWGVDKGAVKVIVKDQVDPDCINKNQKPFKIHRSEVERIAKNRGVL